MQREQPFTQFLVRRGEAMAETKIIRPGRRSERLGPKGGGLQIALQCQVACTCPALDAPPLAHAAEKGVDILFGDDAIADSFSRRG